MLEPIVVLRKILLERRFQRLLAPLATKFWGFENILERRDILYGLVHLFHALLDLGHILGETLDDAAGEAFDKVARLLGLPYPGGPEISKLAKIAEEKNLPNKWSLPRPMLTSPDLDLSFSGLKTAVRYTIQDQILSDEDKQTLCLEFEQAVTDVLIAKTTKALEQTGAKTLIIGGGVIANSRLRTNFKILANNLHLPLLLPDQTTTTDNAVMIAIAGYFSKDKQIETDIRAEGNLSL